MILVYVTLQTTMCICDLKYKITKFGFSLHLQKNTDCTGFGIVCGFKYPLGQLRTYPNHIPTMDKEKWLFGYPNIFMLVS